MHKLQHNLHNLYNVHIAHNMQINTQISPWIYGVTVAVAQHLQRQWPVGHEHCLNVAEQYANLSMLIMIESYGLSTCGFSIVKQRKALGGASSFCVSRGCSRGCDSDCIAYTYASFLQAHSLCAEKFLRAGGVVQDLHCLPLYCGIAVENEIKYQY